MLQLTDAQKLRFKLLMLSSFNLAATKEAYNFIMNGDWYAPNLEELAAAYKEKTEEPDGIYLVMEGGSKVLFDHDAKKLQFSHCVGIGVKMGSKSIVVSLYDMDDEGNYDMTLTAKEDETDNGKYFDNYLDAQADWNGQANTEHLKEIGLNEAISLQPGQYIPSFGEMKFIQLFRKEINEALEFLNADKLQGCYYWTSTELSATYAWLLSLYDGSTYYYTKASSKIRVRAVSAFIS